MADYRGKTVALEWLNKDCPYVKKHYGSGNMQRLQKAYTAKGVVWLSVVSSAEGKQGYVTGPEADADTKAAGASPTAVLLDPTGALGKLYAAKTTPHMYVVDKDGVLRYNGRSTRTRQPTEDRRPREPRRRRLTPSSRPAVAKPVTKPTAVR